VFRELARPVALEENLIALSFSTAQSVQPISRLSPLSARSFASLLVAFFLCLANFVRLLSALIFNNVPINSLLDNVYFSSLTVIQGCIYNRNYRID
jgi:hypothetical protein